MSFFITQLIYLKPGSEAIFDEFESHAIPLIAEHNGTLMLRVRPSADAIIQNGVSAPYEMHLVEFASEEDFKRFAKDPRRQQFVHLKEASVLESVLIKGEIVKAI